MSREAQIIRQHKLSPTMVDVLTNPVFTDENLGIIVCPAGTEKALVARGLMHPTQSTLTHEGEAVAREILEDRITWTNTPDPQTEANRWNEAHEVGTPVLAYPGARPENGGRALKTLTRSRAWVLSHDIAVVLVEYHSGAIALSHIDIDPDPIQVERFYTVEADGTGFLVVDRDGVAVDRASSRYTALEIARQLDITRSVVVGATIPSGTKARLDETGDGTSVEDLFLRIVDLYWPAGTRVAGKDSAGNDRTGTVGDNGAQLVTLPGHRNRGRAYVTVAWDKSQDGRFFIPVDSCLIDDLTKI